MDNSYLNSRPGSSKQHPFRNYRDPPRDERRIEIRRHRDKIPDSHYSEERGSYSISREGASTSKIPNPEAADRISVNSNDKNGRSNASSSNRSSSSQAHDRQYHPKRNPEIDKNRSKQPPEIMEHESPETSRLPQKPSSSAVSSSVDEDIVFVQQNTALSIIRKSDSLNYFDQFKPPSSSSSSSKTVSPQQQITQKVKEKQPSSIKPPSNMAMEIDTIDQAKSTSSKQNGQSSSSSLKRSSSTNDKIQDKQKESVSTTEVNETIDSTMEVETDGNKNLKETRKRSFQSASKSIEVQPSTNLQSKAITSSVPPNRSYGNILKMSHEFNNLLVNKEHKNKYFKSLKTPDLPPKWHPNDLIPESNVVDVIDDGYDSSDNNIPLPSGKGPCGIKSTQQNVALDIHCINRTLQSIAPEQRYKILKSFIDERADCTIFFYIHAKYFKNESMLARVALKRFAMMLYNALHLYELSTIPNTFYGKVKCDPNDPWKIPPDNEYSYDAPGYTEFARAGTSKEIAAIYTEFTKAEINILLDAHLLIEHKNDLPPCEQKDYIQCHSEIIFEWLKIIKNQAVNKKRPPIHHNFTVWCDLALPLRNAFDVLSLMEIIFKPQMASMDESLLKASGGRKYSPEKHLKYYQAALKGLNCKDFGIEKLYCRDDYLWYTAFVGSFFNDICSIRDDQEELYQPYIEAFRHCIDDAKEDLQRKYGNFQQLFSDKKFWEKIVKKRCETIPRPFDLYKNLAAFILEVSQHDPNAFDYTTHLIRPFNKDLKKNLKVLATVVFKKDAMNKNDNKRFVQKIIDDLMAHFYPVLRTFTHPTSEQSAALKLFTIYVLKGFLMEWEEYNKWTKEMREGKKYNREGSGLDLQMIKEYFGKDFMNLPANIMTAIWERKFHNQFFSPKVPKEIRMLLIRSEFKNLPAATVTNILELFGKIDENQIEIKWYNKNDNSKNVEIGSEVFDASDNDVSTTNMSSSPMEVDNSVMDSTNGLKADHTVVDNTNGTKKIDHIIMDNASVSTDNNDSKCSIQMQKDSKENNEKPPSKSGLTRPSKFIHGSLSRWAFNNAEEDCEKKGDKFILAPVNKLKDGKKAAIKPVQKNSSNDYAKKITFNHPLLKEREEKIREDFVELTPEMQKWAFNFTSVVEDIASGKDKRMKKAKEQSSNNSSTTAATISEFCESIQNDGTIFNSSNVSMNDSDLKMLSPYPLIAVCSEIESMIYSFPTECLQSPESDNILERHALKSCTIWDYLQGKRTPINREIIAFLCDMWNRTVQYSQTRKNNNDYVGARNFIREIQNGREVEYDAMVKKIVGVRFPCDLRTDEHLKNFCTLYIDVKNLSYQKFKFSFDITIPDKNLKTIPYDLDEATA